MQSIFSATDAAEDRQICERMVSNNLDLAQRENILLLTGIPKDSPYYSPPAPKKRTFFQFIFHHALRFASRVESPRIFPSLSSPVCQDSCLSQWEVVPSGCDPLSSASHTCEPCTDTTVVPVASQKLAYNSEPVEDELKMIAVVPQTLQQPHHSHGIETSSGFVTPTLRAQVFGTEQDDRSVHQEMTPLLTPLQRAISQAREHGYHLHPRQPLPPSPKSSSQHSPPGLAHLKHRYNLRSHQVAAGDYFRKEASHRAAVAVRNINRHLLIKKADRSLYEPSGIIMPEYELTRLRVVLAPKRFPVRLWKKEYRGPADWIEIEEKTPAGGPVIFKRDSHLRKELSLRLKRVPAQRHLAPPVPPKEPLQPILTNTEVVHSKVVEKVSPVEPAKQLPAPPASEPASLRPNTPLPQPPVSTPGCLDPALAEMHRQSLLKKYYNSVPKPVVPSADQTSEEEQEPVKPKVIDPSSSEETLCEGLAENTVEKSKVMVDSPKEALKAIISSNIVKLRTGSDIVQENRHARLSLSPRKALRAVKNQAKSLLT